MAADPPAYRTPAELLDRARELFAQADRELRRGLGQQAFDEDNPGCLYRANLLFNAARAGFEGVSALAVMGLEEVGDPSEEILAAVRGRAFKDGTWIDTFRCTVCGEPFETMSQLAGHHVAEHDLRPTDAPADGA